MTREDKLAIVEELSAKLASTPFFYIVTTNGLSVADTNKFRSLCFENGVEYKVVKNTLIKKALDTLDADYSGFDGGVLKGFSGIMFHPESGKVPAKLIKEFRSKTSPDKFNLKGASIDSSVFVGADQLDALIALKSKQELVGEVIGLLQSPARNVVSALQSGGGKLAGILKTLSEKGE
jgi:large subunit ribosomal protein L10